jgi:hypothetical protein
MILTRLLVLLFAAAPQRNMGLLEKIVQSLTATTKPSPELGVQYKAQIDVLGQLEDKIRRLLQQTPPPKAAAPAQQWSKLQRDFDRVQQRVTAMQSAVERWKKQQQSATAVHISSSTPAATSEDQKQQMQLLIQEDVRSRSWISLWCCLHPRLSHTPHSCLPYNWSDAFGSLLIAVIATTAPMFFGIDTITIFHDG